MHKTVKTMSMALCAFMVAVLVAGCGGGGGGPSVSDYMGSYRGTFLLTAASSSDDSFKGSFLLQVDNNGSARADLNGEFSATGKVDSSGRFDLSSRVDLQGLPVDVRITGQINAHDNQAKGQIKMTSPDSSETINGNFSATRASTSNLQKQQPDATDGKTLQEAIKKALHAQNS